MMCVKMKYLNQTNMLLFVNIVIRRNLSELKSLVGTKLAATSDNIKKFRKEHGNKKIGEINVNMIYGGMRGMLCLICETSEIDPENGIRFRGYTVPDCEKLLPKADDGKQPLPEALFWLLLTGEIPNAQQVKHLSKDWAQRSELPPYVVTMLNNFPKDLHPMAQFSCALTALNRESQFVQAFAKGVPKHTYWEYAYEDSMNLIAKEIVVAATIYNNVFRNREKTCDVDCDRDWTYNFLTMIGYNDTEFIEFMRLYLTIHCDHEGGNVSAHTCHLVGSTLADPYLSFAAALNGLAGPLHGLANQEVLVWITKMQKEIGLNASDDKVQEFILKTLKSGQVIPGYGHAVLRKPDPRFICQREFALKHMPNDNLFKLVSQLYSVVPRVLQSLKKVANPWPNVDAHSGVVLQYYGMKEINYYTVLFGLSRALGVLSWYILARGYGFPIERPKSATTNTLIKLVNG